MFPENIMIIKKDGNTTIKPSEKLMASIITEDLAINGNGTLNDT